MKKKAIALIVVLLVILGGVVGAMFLNNNGSTDKTNDVAQNNLSDRNENKEIISNNTNNEEKQSNIDNNDNDNTETESKKALVVYFSRSGNTEKVANFIKDATDADMVELETVKEYPSDYDGLLDYAQNEQQQNARPELKTKISNIDEYDVIFLGYPNWWGDMPMPLYTFLDEYDLSGKIIAPFVTSGGSGLSGTPNKIKNIQKNATVTEGLSISGSRAGNSQSTVNNWIEEIGF